MEEDPSFGLTFRLPLRTGETFVLISMAGQLMAGVETSDGTDRRLFSVGTPGQQVAPREVLRDLAGWAMAAADQEMRRWGPGTLS